MENFKKLGKTGGSLIDLSYRFRLMPISERRIQEHELSEEAKKIDREFVGVYLDDRIETQDISGFVEYLAHNLCREEFDCLISCQDGWSRNTTQP